ncbi:tape measure protein [Ramlibacter alkalitolerans]|uniref:Tape measure protein n=1 Tax=Ramlibacter alkalitolerans TaxID=2039631 RepID=A0ABS1JUH5_9BURK|nr:tape measure protein [Ramlibacter alkalitolerans]MBL0427945.1 tape measure protein [Ramlibacter alkalitolerans]
MATARKDVELAFRVSTPGAESIGDLGSDLHSLGGEGGKLAAEFERSAAALDTLRKAERAARDELRSAQQALQANKDAIRALRLETDGAGKDSDEYRSHLLQLKRAQFESEQQVRSLRAAYDSSKTATREAAAAHRALADQVKSSAGAQAESAKTLRDELKGVAGQLTQIRSAAAALVGGQMLGGMLGDVARTADEFANLAARVKLATSEGTGFNQAFSGVFEVAQRTNTAVEATGMLFTRILQAGKAMGMGVSDALALTETVNQAVQLSGASAEASTAAVTQLLQALQSGVLRGDEFNSVMEQAPRLAQALAAGLGVTTGELRKMAEAGRLTSTTVVAALQGQATALQAEFDQLPATLGRAITNLSTAWTQYVGEVDKAHGISTAAANAINVLARNLDTVAGILLSAGKAAAAYKAIQLAQTLLGQAQATTAATAATAANTAATVANTAAKRDNAAATGAAGDAAAGGAGKFAAAIGTLKLAALATVVTNFREIGTAIGETAARWVGYGKIMDRAEAAMKAGEEATRANAAAKAALAQKLQLAADKALGLSMESRKLVDEFEGVRLKGESTAEALEKLTKSLRIGDIKGIADAGAALDALGLKGELSAAQIRDSWTKALKDVDLGIFATEARAAFDSSEQGARRLAAALDGATREAIRRAGLDFQLISGGMGAAAQSALNDLDLIVSRFDSLQASGADTGRVLAASIGKAIDSADSKAAIESVKVQIEGVRNVLGDKVADGFMDQAKTKALELADALDKALPGVQSLREAYRQLGMQVPEDLARVADKNKEAWDAIQRDGRASAEVLRTAFARYAQSVLDASGAVGTGSRAATQELLKSEAAARGLAVEFDNAGRIIVRGAFDSAAAVGKMGEAFDKTTRSIERQSAALQELYDRNKIARPAGTADGFTKNADGSAAGTFTNTLPVDLADRLMRTGGKGMTPEEINAAIQQADAAFRDMQAFTRQNPGASSTEYQQSTTALENAANVARQKQTGGAIRTVKVQIGGSPASNINVASQQDSDALVGMLRQLETQSRSAA